MKFFRWSFVLASIAGALWTPRSAIGQGFVIVTDPTFTQPSCEALKRRCEGEASRRKAEWDDACIETWENGLFDPANPEGNDLGLQQCLDFGKQVYKQDMDKCQKDFEECKKNEKTRNCVLLAGSLSSLCGAIGGSWIVGAGGTGSCSAGGTVLSAETLQRIAASLFLYWCVEPDTTAPQ